MTTTYCIYTNVRQWSDSGFTWARVAIACRQFNHEEETERAQWYNRVVNNSIDRNGYTIEREHSNIH